MQGMLQKFWYYHSEGKGARMLQGKITRIMPMNLLLWVSILLTVSLSDASPLLRLPTQGESGAGTSNAASTHRPLIGILSHPGDGVHGKVSRGANVSYIAASYVKFVEAGGARAIPLIYNEPYHILEQKFQAVNGLIFTGGSCKDGLYYQTVKKLFKRALEENDKGEYFPVFAVCLGFELLSKIVSQDENILETFDAENYASPLFFESDAAKSSSLFKRFPADLLHKLSLESLVMQNHRFGVSVERMSTNAGLSSFFKLLTTSVDKRNKTYVSTVEAYKYPVTAVQWHPEKNAFEWQIPTIPHSAEAILVTQSVASFLISEARKSSHRPTFQQEQEQLIYNFFPTYSGKLGGSFDQVYVFT